MKRIAINISGFLACLTIISSCASHKFNYSQAYYFKYYNYHKTDQATLAENSKANHMGHESPLLVSSEKIIAPASPDRIEQASQHLPDKIHLPENRMENISRVALEEHIKSLSRSERKSLIRQLKAEMKAFKNAESASIKKFDPQDVQRTSELRGYTRTGVIIGGLGVILLLLGGIFGVSALTFVGVVGVLAGVVFILLDVL